LDVVLRLGIPGLERRRLGLDTGDYPSLALSVGSLPETK
jgi:hypothetical protein